MQRLWAVAMAATFVLAGCGSEGGSSIGSSAPADKADRVVEIGLKDPNQFDPATIAVKVGETITFKLTNQGATLHEFSLGDEKMQADHAKEMGDMGSEPMKMDDEPNAVTVAAGQSKSLTWKFTKAGAVLYGCHQPGHYANGMKGTITVA